MVESIDQSKLSVEDKENENMNKDASQAMVDVQDNKKKEVGKNEEKKEASGSESDEDSEEKDPAKKEMWGKIEAVLSEYYLSDF